MRPAVAVLGGFLFTFCAANAAAQNTERTVLGWTGSGDVVVAVVERGERMVDGVSKDYYAEATEVWPTATAGAPRVYLHGESVGPVPDELAAALPATQGDAARGAVQPDVASPANAAGTHRLAWFRKQRIDKPDDQTFVCKTRYRVVLIATPERRAYTLVDAEAAGEPSRRQDEARCPSVRVDPHWSADGQSAFALITHADRTEATAANVTALEAHPWATLTPTVPLIVTLTSGAEAEAWRAMASGDFATASTKFGEAKLTAGQVIVDAIQGKKRVTKAADSAFKRSKKTPRDAILRAIAYVAAGVPKKTPKWIDDAVASVSSYAELLEFAAMFEPIDPNIANQLAVLALSHPSAAAADTTAGWTLLGQGLLDIGEYSKAEESLGKIEKPTPASLAALAMLNLDKHREKLAVRYAEDLLFDNPGDCEGYLVQGRLRSLQGDNVDARALFEAALACDPTLDEAAFYAADFARLAGDVQRAHAGFDHFLRVAPPRHSDQIRSLRREAAERWSKRLARSGVVLTDVSCRKNGAGFLCTGTLENTGAAPAADIGVEVRLKGKIVGQSSIPAIGPNEMAPFGVSFEAKSLADATVTAGRTADERKANEMPAR